MTIICFKQNTYLKNCRDSEALQPNLFSDVELSVIIDFSIGLTYCQLC